MLMDDENNHGCRQSDGNLSHDIVDQVSLSQNIHIYQGRYGKCHIIIYLSHISNMSRYTCSLSWD
jgi:hypothetical protein